MGEVGSSFSKCKALAAETLLSYWIVAFGSALVLAMSRLQFTILLMGSCMGSCILVGLGLGLLKFLLEVLVVLVHMLDMLLVTIVVFRRRASGMTISRLLLLLMEEVFRLRVSFF